MSLTSYRAAPPRVTTSAAPHLLRHGNTTEETSMQDTWLGKPVPVYPHRCLGLGSAAAFRRLTSEDVTPAIVRFPPNRFRPIVSIRRDLTAFDAAPKPPSHGAALIAAFRHL